MYYFFLVQIAYYIYQLPEVVSCKHLAELPCISYQIK